MLDKQQKLEISHAELAVIEAALHTQSKILHVQASAGATSARARLNEVKRVLARIAEQAPTPEKPARSGTLGWFGKRMPG